ncbi:hypothetical protein D1Z97_01320 [Riemerella anatipestifer]|uniref:hypothetical protein n=1 Tax=Riemerella anatipestifer TaxID=34085 RepID=UPI00129E5AE0|nr:hypothetical protein [Riemerella anatipestifer]MRM96823.1 hypothetical protein [Riemerella anatipestifer]MRM99854.1 hypothetical protein [Riemerella anatipestifer]MRN01784.1 hypothetical protein [Riemerella anatipestifer]
MYKSVKFLFGIVLGLISLFALFQGSLIGFILIFASAILVFPPTSEIVKNKLPFLNNRGLRITLAVLFYFIGFGNFISSIISEQKAKSPQQVNTTKEKEITKSELGLKNISPADIYPNFEEKGFTIDKQISTDGSFFYCTKEQSGIKYDITIFSENNINEVTEIKINAYRNQPNLNTVEDMKQFLKYAVSIPYDGADVEKVQKFIEENYNNHKASITISGVKFTIYCSSEFVRLVTIQ